SMGAKPIYYHESPLAAGVIKANDRCLFMYNGPGERYYLIAIDRWGVDLNALATVAHTGDYNDLTNKPTIPQNVGDLTNDAGYITANDISAQVNADWNATEGPAEILNKPVNADFGQGVVRNKVNNPSGATNIAVNFSTYQLVNGGVVSLVFARAVPAGATLNINNKGAKPIYYHESPLPDGLIKANDRCLFMYNGPGERYYLIAIDRWGVDLNALATVAHTGSYNDLTDKPNIPTNVSAFNNDAGYITEEQMPAGMTGTQTGDIMYWDAATGTWIMMPAGSAGQVLTVENGVPVWANLPDHVTMNLPPTVTTSAPSEVTQASALCGGEVTSDGSVQLTACGVCWSTHHFPTIADAHTENDLSVSAFTSHVTGLAHHTTYYVRAYATNSIGTTYGAEMTFTTEDIPSGDVTMPDPCSADTNTIWHPTLGSGSTLCAGTDSVELTLNNYQYGNIQWQYSTDTISWYDIPGANDTLLVYKPDQTQYVRASVSTANCPPEYSPVKLLLKTPLAYAGISRTANVGDTVRLQAYMEEDATGSWQILQGTGGFLSHPNEDYTKFYGTDSLYRLRWTLTNSCGYSSDDISVRYVQTVVSDRVVMVDTTDIIFSDSAQMAQGYYVISFSDPNIVIGDSTILVSLINGGFMRMVDSWSMANDSTYAMYTTQATLYDILESGVIQFDAISGESEADSAVQNTQPAQEVLYLDHIPTREEIRSNPEMTKSGKVYMLKLDLAREESGLGEHTQGFSLRGLRQQSTSTNKKDTTVKWLVPEYAPDFKYKLENVNFFLDANPVFEYDKDMRHFQFGIYDAKLHLEADFVPNITLGQFTLTFVEWNPIKVEVPFAVPIGPVVVPFTVDCGVTLGVEGSVDISAELRYKLTADATLTEGVNYWGKSHTFTTDRGRSGSFNVERVSDNLEGSVDFEVSIAGYMNVKLAAVAGPRVQTGFKAKMKYCYGLNEKQGWKGKIDAKLYTKLDLKAIKLVDKIIPENWSTECTIPLVEREFPDTMYLYSGNNHTIQNTQASNIVKVKVEGSGGKPIRNALVYFEPKDGGAVSNHVAFTDTSGIAQTIWTPSPSSAVHQLYAYAYDCEQNPIKGAPVVFTAYEYAGCTSSTLNLRYLLTGNTLTLQASGGEPPYTYSVDGEHFVPLSELPPLSALASYVLSVKDTNGCIRSITYGIPANTDCDWSNLDMDAEFSNGALILQGTGGTPPYRYSLGGISYSTNNVFPSLSPGVYTAYVMDATDCDYNRSITVEDDDILDLTSYNSQPCAGTTTVTDYDGNVYPTIQIGQQCWMKENLRTTHYADGEIIPIGSACYYPNGNAGNRAQYGLLYTWYAATRNTSSSSNPSGVRGACPYGWHVPSDDEWSQLLSQPQLLVCPAKALASKFGWNISTTACSPGYENWYNNGSGFNAPPAGLYNNGYGNFGSVAWFWSTTNYPYNVWSRFLSYDGAGVGRDYNGSDINYKARAYSVRCLRD
ncbi:MAG: fibrobacter succinogenes major paralogous domain-containing protein, partial [Bacteroidales bacterium]|nr:fibrobacter succinogenes major paralogous domain-containing protein [Bacteroidales bacterium]